jgi:hypothetical protein
MLGVMTCALTDAAVNTQKSPNPNRVPGSGNNLRAGRVGNFGMDFLRSGVG